MTEDPPPPAPRLAPLDKVSAALPRRRRRRWWPWALAALVLGAGVAALVGGRRTEVTASSVMSAYPSAQYGQLTASGYVVAQRRAAVSSKATGRLVDLRVREGSIVKAGELIGRLDDSDVRAAVAAAQAGQRQAEAGLQQAEAGQLQAAAALRQAQVELTNAEAELQRARALLAQGFFSAQAVDAATRRADAARAGIASAQAGIASAAAASVSAKAAIAAAAAQVAVQQVGQANTEIRAPFDGVVLVKNANVGDMITPFSSAAGSQGAVVTMADMGTLEVEADVSEANVGKVVIDMPVEIVLDALPDARFRGVVVRVVPTVDRAKATVMTKVRFEKIDARVLPEMSAKVVFLSRRPSEADLQPVLAVNPRTVVEREGRKVVFRIAGDTAEAVPVTPGRALGDVVEVGGGALKAGDRLVLGPGEKLAAGARVSVAGK